MLRSRPRPRNPRWPYGHQDATRGRSVPTTGGPGSAGAAAALYSTKCFRTSGGSGASKSSAIQTCPSQPPGLRGFSIRASGTSRALGDPAFAITISSPAAARSTSSDSRVFASYRLTVCDPRRLAIAPPMVVRPSGLVKLVRSGRRPLRAQRGHDVARQRGHGADAELRRHAGRAGDHVDEVEAEAGERAKTGER